MHAFCIVNSELEILRFHFHLEEGTMLNAYERQLVLSYLANAASRFHYTYQQEALAQWVADNHDILALNDENEVLSDLWEHCRREKKLSARDW